MSSFDSKRTLAGRHSQAYPHLLVCDTMSCPDPWESMRRREFIKAILYTGAAWPLAARAQQGERMRRVGVLEGISEDAYLAAFLQRLQQLGWVDGHNVRIDTPRRPRTET